MWSPIDVIRSPTMAGGLFAVRNILNICGLMIQEWKFAAEKNVNSPLVWGSAVGPWRHTPVLILATLSPGKLPTPAKRLRLMQ